MANPWFRFYSEFATDAKVQMISEAMQRRIVMLFCLQNSNALRDGASDEEISFQLRITPQETADTKALLLQLKIIKKDWTVINWDKRQFRSDLDLTRAERQKRWRERNRNALRDDPVTPLDTDTDTDKRKSKALVASKPRPSKTPPPDFGVGPELVHWHGLFAPHVDIRHETEIFKNHVFKRTYTEWSKVWKNWILRAAKQPNQGNRHDSRKSLADRNADRANDIFRAAAENDRSALDPNLADRRRRLGKPLDQ